MISWYTLDEFHAVVAIVYLDGAMSVIEYSFVFVL